jgi:heterotetrameric sarcosine oxidase gamma subunit
VSAGAGLAEIGPLEELLLRGPGALMAAMRLVAGDDSEMVGRAVPVDLRSGQASAWLLAPDEVLLVGPGGGAPRAMLAEELASGDVSAIEMTGARTSLRLAGQSAPAILAELCPADTTPATMAPADLVQAPLAGVRAFICRDDSGIHPGYTIMLARDEAAYVWDAFCRVGAAHGLTPVGPAAVAPAAMAPKEPG